MKFHHVRLSDFLDLIDVECPGCGAHARVATDPERKQLPRFSCLQCGHVKTWKGNQFIRATGSLRLANRVVHMGQSSDPYFGYALWYQTSCCGHTLWAYNRHHLQFYQAYISDKLRERSRDEHGWSNQSLQSRLPGWMLAGNNRKAVLKKIDVLMRK